MTITPPRFYWTAHPGDLMRTRLLPGAHVLVVASAFWDADRARFRVRRPPADHIASLAIDSGGFTAAARWGRYPWTPAQYVDWIHAEARDVPLDWCAIMDYACERDVNRTALATNRARIKATIRHDRALRSLAPDLPWLSVLQGNTFEGRALDLRLRRRLDLLFPHMGVGSICRRPGREAAAVLAWYGARLPATRYHAFGLDIRTFDADDAAYFLLQSWDSYSWTWPRGAKRMDRPADLLQRPGEGRSAYTRRIAVFYHDHVIRPRLLAPRQPALF
jgi:hypothetical protein